MSEPRVDATQIDAHIAELAPGILPLEEQYASLTQQRHAAILGMWTFLATEILFFGGLFLAYTVYRSTYSGSFGHAGRELNLAVGTINTAILLTSSFAMALAVHAAQTGDRAKLVRGLLVTWALGFVFLLLKAYEYYDDIEKHIAAGRHMLYFIYYAMTGLHALHLTIGLGVIGVMAVRARRGDFSPEYHAPIEVTGLYWHFVDAVWIFLYPLLYLMDRHK